MNPRVLAIAGSLIRQVAARKKHGSIDLGLGEPTLLPSRAHFEHAMRHVVEYGVKYAPNAGDPRLREAIARHYGYPRMDTAANVCVTAGSQEAMYVTLMTLLDASRDELLVVEPAFPSYVKMAALGGVACRTVTMREDDDFAFDADRILAGLTPATRAIVLCSPCNPTGRVLSRDQGELLASALERRGGDPVWLIHDEIYREQTFVDDPAYLAQRYPHTIVTNSVSKSNALTGLRLGWILGPRPFVEQAIKAHAWVTSCTDTFAQQVAIHVFESNALGEHSGWYADQRRNVIAALDAHALRYAPIDGAFYACVRLPDGTNSLDAANELIERHDVLAIPGVAFGAALEGWLRLSWVAQVAHVREGIARIARYVSS